ncbi:hypothetical protein J1N35_003886 [Gossypium stocksii]|uniref:DNA/RNA-binding protein Alba-like domain-containing protein n=1 Tax=Gossypium stocksii TaxID=47602 RepID=A0A9D4AHU1_9ROSI|nr:hypothetical protein J1N35_003886 [Gossypium stocksii]
MDSYQRVEKPKAETPIDEKEIRISSQGSMRNYISHALILLQEKGSNQIITSIGSTDISDMWEPLEEGLVPLETTRHVSIITITLSKIELDMSSAGYQPPLPANQVKAGSHNDRDGRRMPRSRGNAEYEDGGRNHNRG